MKQTITVYDKSFTKFIDRDRISTEVNRVAGEIQRDYTGTVPHFIVILKGSFVFAADLIRAVGIPLTVDVLRAHSYGAGMKTQGSVDIPETVPDVHGRSVIVVEDIVDSGLTISTVLNALAAKHPASLNVVSLLRKETSKQHIIPVRYSCFTIHSEFVVGYGLDYNEHGRQLADLYELVHE